MYDKVYLVIEEYEDNETREFEIVGVYSRILLAVEKFNILKEQDEYEMKQYIKEDDGVSLVAYDDKHCKKYNLWIEDQKVLTTVYDMVCVKCYGTEKTMERQEAIKEFEEGMKCCEGSEQERYASIYRQLINGCTYCTDEED